MSGEGFDQLSKALATSTSRRTFFKVAAAAAAAGVLSAVRAPSAAATHNANCRHFGDNCRSNAECCTGACIDFHCACAPGTVLCEKTGQCVPTCVPPKVLEPETCDCVCPLGTTECGNTCCEDATLKCCNGVCIPKTSTCCPGGQVCPEGTTCCGTTQCCTSGQTCNNGTCGVSGVVCAPGETACVSGGVTVKCCPENNPVCCPSGGSFSCKKTC